MFSCFDNKTTASAASSAVVSALNTRILQLPNPLSLTFVIVVLLIGFLVAFGVAQYFTSCRDVCVPTSLLDLEASTDICEPRQEYFWLGRLESDQSAAVFDQDAYKLQHTVVADAFLAASLAFQGFARMSWTNQTGEIMYIPPASCGRDVSLLDCTPSGNSTAGRQVLLPVDVSLDTKNGTVMESLTYLPGSMAAQAFVASQFRTSNSTIDAWVNDGTANDFQNTTFLDKFDYFAKVVIPSLALTSDDSTTFFMEFMMHPLDLTLFRDNANVARSCLCTGECNVTGLPTRLQDRISLLVDPVEIITTLHNYYATTTSSMPGSLYTWRQTLSGNTTDVIVRKSSASALDIITQWYQRYDNTDMSLTSIMPELPGWKFVDEAYKNATLDMAAFLCNASASDFTDPADMMPLYVRYAAAISALEGVSMLMEWQRSFKSLLQGYTLVCCREECSNWIGLVGSTLGYAACLEILACFIVLFAYFRLIRSDLIPSVGDIFRMFSTYEQPSSVGTAGTSVVKTEELSGPSTDRGQSSA